MHAELERFLIVLAVGLAVAIGAKRIGIPYNVALVVVGVLLVVLDLLPHTPMNPEAILLVFLPMLVFEGALFADEELVARHAVPRRAEADEERDPRGDRRRGKDRREPVVEVRVREGATLVDAQEPREPRQIAGAEHVVEEIAVDAVQRQDEEHRVVRRRRRLVFLANAERSLERSRELSGHVPSQERVPSDRRRPDRHGRCEARAGERRGWTLRFSNCN